jgi:UDP-N-acetylmuramoylalanine--D-glutamate ligase
VATTPESAAAGLASFEGPVVLIAGGYDKKLPLDSLAREAALRAAGVVLMGNTTDRLEDLLTRFPDAPPVRRARNMTEAVRLARDLADGRGVVLLSPGAASYDMYRNFEERGDDFKGAVGEILE